MTGDADTNADDLKALYGPWALIAGGSEGIGLAFARQLAGAGINLVLLARRAAPLAQARNELESAFNIEVRTHTIDLTDGAIDVYLENITRGLDVGLLIYNAGAMHGAALYLDESLAKKQALISLNCNGPVVFTHCLGRKMRERGRGGIMLLSSMSGLTGGAFVATYAATKAFDIVLAESLWAELHSEGIHVLGLIAGATATPAMASSGATFSEGQAMDAAQVAREGLAQLPHGPVHVAGDGNRLGAAFLRAENRRATVQAMTAGAAQMYDLRAPDLPD